METHATHTTLGLDASSTTIGFCVLEYDGTLRDSGTLHLTGKAIEQRCRQAYAFVQSLLFVHSDCKLCAVESPVARFAKAVIPQARVSGAILTAAALLNIPVMEVTPAEAKLILTGKGNADKAQMCAVSGIADEHAADAYAIAHTAQQATRILARREVLRLERLKRSRKRRAAKAETVRG